MYCILFNVHTLYVVSQTINISQQLSPTYVQLMKVTGVFALSVKQKGARVSTFNAHKLSHSDNIFQHLPI